MSFALLFLCTGNSCRSQMAEGFGRALFGDRAAVHSAGIDPVDVNPRAVTAMAEVGIDIRAQRSKSIDDVPLDQVDLVVTLCGDAAERCPTIPGANSVHWPLTDPAKATGTEAEIFAAFCDVRDEIRARVTALSDSLDV